MEVQGQSSLQTIISTAAYPASLNLSQFKSPFLLSYSLSHLFSHPVQPLSKILSRLNMAFTFSIDCMLDSIKAFSMMESEANGLQPKFHIVFMDAARPKLLAQELRSIALQWTKKLRLNMNEMAGDSRILFIDWQVLKSLKQGGNLLETEWKRGFSGYLAWNHGRKQGKAEEIWTWEEAVRGM